MLSTFSGTIAVGTFSIPDDNGITQKALSGIFTFLSFTIAIATGYLKVYQVQERLEQYIKHKQDWVIFSTSVASELQLPIKLRRDGLWVIIKNKSVYLDLLKTDLEIPAFIYKEAKPRLPRLKQINMDISSLSNIILDIGYQEFMDMNSQDLQESATDSAGGKKASAIITNMLQNSKTVVNSLADNSYFQRSVPPASTSMPKLGEAPTKITLIVHEEIAEEQGAGAEADAGAKAKDDGRANPPPPHEERQAS